MMANNQKDNTRDLWAEINYPLCTALGLRITPKTGDAPPGIAFEHLRERLQATGHWDSWCNWGAGGLTAGAAGIYPWDVEDFLAGLPNTD